MPQNVNQYDYINISKHSRVYLMGAFLCFLKKFTSKFTLFSPYCFRDCKANSPTAIGTTLEVLT
ncbi:hypothetical protein AZJ96_10085 [Streptococcus pneumoniae]|nr:hypothetical protein AZK21_02155 [Streptococcus pneumoniae]TVW14012.1 hypothetical protein AZK09_01825 [Streptococcus pneumoniae]TVW21747.1 hypothetical protein AZK07_08695 [Streptococcus pneumoniae]TVX07831.1 hypothetical protein AZJ54_08770 [Streptococcus pneumoniae]TXM04784.1 hypothetical protein AZJ96_10085 [Streptococcus pneumoniae]